MTGSRNLHSTKKAQVATSLLTGATFADAAHQAGVSERTVYRWLGNDEFQGELRSQEKQVLNACAWRLVSLSKRAIDALQDVLENPSQAGAANKRLAAGAVLEVSLKFLDILTLEERLVRLERKVFNEG